MKAYQRVKRIQDIDSFTIKIQPWIFRSRIFLSDTLSDQYAKSCGFNIYLAPGNFVTGVIGQDDASIRKCDLSTLLLLFR